MHDRMAACVASLRAVCRTQGLASRFFLDTGALVGISCRRSRSFR